MEPFASTEEKTAYQDRRTRRRLATGFATVVAIWLGAFVGAAAMNRAHDDAGPPPRNFQSRYFWMEYV